MATHILGTTLTGTAFPSDTILLVPAPPPAVPLRPPGGAWELVVVAVRTTDTAGAPVFHRVRRHLTLRPHRYEGNTPRTI